MDLFYQYENYVYLFCGATVIFLFRKYGSLRSVVEAIYSPVQIVASFILDAHKESDGNGGKPSYSRIMGTVVIANIIRMALLEKDIPEALMTMFWVLVGYQLVSKILVQNPMIFEFIKMRMGAVVPASTRTTESTVTTTSTENK